MIYTVHIYNSKHGVSDEEQLEMAYNYGYGKGMSAHTKPLPSVPSPNKAR